MNIKSFLQQTKNITTYSKLVMADVFTPVGVYQKLHHHFPEILLLESNDFANAENSHSIIAVDPIETFEVRNHVLTVKNEIDENTFSISKPQEVPDYLKMFKDRFVVSDEFKPFLGIFGHSNFEAYQYFDTLKLNDQKKNDNIPDIRYGFYKYLLYFDHFKDELTILENCIEGDDSKMTEILDLLLEVPILDNEFNLEGEEYSNVTDEEFKEYVRKGIHHCQVGDVFQIVLSRRFYQHFTGNDFNVYRALRTINPSPFLFYFDMVDYRIFGSSPESQLNIKNGVASVNPIAGTYKRTGDKEKDMAAAIALREDPKENAEHIMLVDLARNDLSRHTDTVIVNRLKEIHYFSHVIHLVSNVQGQCPADTNAIRVFADTFPAGTLSGAPKFKAIKLIDEYENCSRGIYGGGIGMFGMDGSVNHAIIIRSFLSIDNVLIRQAGAGIVVSSKLENELQEVNNKLGALKKALVNAEKTTTKIINKSYPYENISNR